MEEEIQKKKRQELVKVILTEILMGIAIVCLTVFLLFMTLGYNISNDGNVERTGLVQINSNPTGATISIDGNEEILARTNSSKTYSAGEHTIKLTRGGYGDWEKTINVTEGYYYRLSYPRLFLNKIEKTELIELKDIKIASMSPEGNLLFVLEKGADKAKLVKLSDNNATVMEENLEDLFSGVKNGDAEVKVMEWSGDGSKILIKTTFEEENEWVLIDTKNIQESVNLTKMFGMKFTDLRLENGSGSKIFAIVNNELRELDTNGGSISKILVNDVEKIENNAENVVFLTTINENGQREVGTYRSGDKGGVNIYEVNGEGDVEIGIGEYFEDDILAIFDKGRMVVYQGEIPAYEQEETKIEITMIRDAGFLVADKFEIRGGGELVFARGEGKVAVFDAEAFDVVRYEINDINLKWLDNFMLYSTEGGAIEVMDFDGLNKRMVIDEGAKEGTIVTISKSGRWMYYINTENKLVAAKVS